MSKVYELIFNMQEKKLRDGTTAIILTDSEGYLCGIYATVKDAERAIPAIKNNISRGSVPRKMLRHVPSYATVLPEHFRKQTRQVSIKK